VSYKTIAFIEEMMAELDYSRSKVIALLVEEALTARGYPIEINRHFKGGHRNKYGIPAVVRPMARIKTND
jgi:hypothetical protein